MKWLYFICFVCLFAGFSPSQAQDYEHPLLMEKIVNHQKIAILPFGFKIAGVSPDEAAIRLMSREKGTMMQNLSYYLVIENRANYSITTQDLTHTNQVLQSLGYVYHDTLTTAYFARVADSLQVDALLTGAVEVYDDVFKGGGRYGTDSYVYENVNVYFYLFEAQTGDKIWQISLNNYGDLTAKEQKQTVEQNAESFIRKALLYFPYRKDAKKKKKRK
ncbi:MAG: hypothetical protein MUE85_23055 [Microscillaceae bacterium]|jgi:hypothetical protein|nr:hypothetical protein [Microscillaceae bacterium]